MDDRFNRTVRFRVGDVIHPRPVQVLLELFRHLRLEGEVVAATTDGDAPYLVVRVQGLSEAVIVPQAKALTEFDEEAAPVVVSATARG